MNYETVGVVKYYPIDNYFIVGNNQTQAADGITDPSYEGEIIIKEKIKGRPILEIAKYAFFNCKKITKVYIYANIRSIGTFSFCYCPSLEYINIPASVTFMGSACIYTSKGQGDNTIINLPMTVEFNKGRIANLFIDSDCFSFRNIYYIIYPSKLIPKYSSAYAFSNTKTAHICASESFTFYTKPTTTDQNKCPAPFFKSIRRNECTYNRCNKQSNIYILIYTVIQS